MKKFKILGAALVCLAPLAACTPNEIAQVEYTYSQSLAANAVVPAAESSVTSPDAYVSPCVRVVGQNTVDGQAKKVELLAKYAPATWGTGGEWIGMWMGEPYQFGFSSIPDGAICVTD